MQEMKERMILEIRKAIAPGGSRRVSLQMNQHNYWAALNRLLGMSEPVINRLIKLPGSKRAEYKEAWNEDNDAWKDYWQDPNNRTTTIEFTDLFVHSYAPKHEDGGENEVERFSEFMHDSIDSVQAVE